MVYLCLDTCVWLELLKIRIYEEDNLFDELLFWIVNGHITCITTPNLLNEWKRDKAAKHSEILSSLKAADNNLLRKIGPIADFTSTFEPDSVEKTLHKRIEKVDNLFATKALVADCEEKIYADAIKRCLACIAPNHAQDSFRDTVNILTLLHFVENESFSPCYFVTNNYKDFSSGKSDKLTIHHQLESDFKLAKVEYIFFDTEAGNFGGKLRYVLSAFNLPSFNDYLRNQRELAEQKKLGEKKMAEKNLMNQVDPRFLENLPLLDLILEKTSPSDTDKQILDIFFKKHPGYKEYFMKNLGNKDDLA